MVLKIPMKMLNTINDALTYMWKKIADITDANKIHIIYESYFEKFLKGLEPLRRTPDVEPIEFIKLPRQSPVPAPLHHFCCCLVNKINLQNISWKFFADMSKTVGSQWYLVVVLFRLIADKTVKYFVKMYIHLNQN